MLALEAFPSCFTARPDCFYPTPLPVRYVVNTHWHDDHHNGNQVYRELWPGVEFIAHRQTREDMFAQTYATRGEDIQRIADDVARYERWAREGKDDEDALADILVPGHGPVQKNRDYLHQVQGLLTSLVTEVRSEVARGATLEETKEKVTLSEWKTRFAGDDARRQRSFDAFFTSPAVERAWYQEKAVSQKVRLAPHRKRHG